MQGFALHPRGIDRERAASAVAVAAVHAALGWALLTGLGVSIPDKAQEVLETFNVVTPPPPPPEPPQQPPRPLKERAPEKEGAAAPPNLKSRATEVIAPKTPIPIPPPVTVAEKPGPGLDSTQGNAPIAGPGTGAGGYGDGTGSGRYGNGPGGGGGGGRPAVLLRRGLGDLGCRTPEVGCPGGEVGIRFRVDVDGRARGCVVTRSSGVPELDRQTCPRIEARLRYDPARDASGRKVVQFIAGVQEWEEVVAEADPDDDRPRRR